jgi:hypothetical protein
MDRTSSLLSDAVKFVAVVQKYEIQKAHVLEMRLAFRKDIVDELEQYRSKPKPDHFDRSTFL